VSARVETDPIPVRFLDDRVVAADKPPGTTVVPAGGASPASCLRARLEAQLGFRLWVVHRLDLDTSGVVLFARDADTHRALCAAFEARLVRQTYLAFTLGLPPAREGRIDTPLHAAKRGRVRPAAPHETGSQSAATRYTVRRRWQRVSDRVALVEARPETSRHHQVRAHLRSIGAPILFDSVYGGAAAARGLDEAPAGRLALHASRIVVQDPGNPGAVLACDAPLPPDLTALVRWLGREWEELGAG